MIMTPRTANSEPSKYCPCQSHSPHSTLPVIEEDTTSAVKSGTAWKIAAQFLATYARPPKLRPGCTGCELA